MEYLNDKVYMRGEEITVVETVDASLLTIEGGGAYKYLMTDLLGKVRGGCIRLQGPTPDVDSERATITLTGEVGAVPDDEYTSPEGVLGFLPGGTVDYNPLYTLKPLRVRGEIEDFEPPGLLG